MNTTLAAALFVLSAASPASTEGRSFPVTIRVDAARPLGELAPIWRFFGADEPNYAHMKDGRKLLQALGELGPKAVYFRTHNLLTSGDGTPALKWGSTNAYSEDAAGRPVFDWSVLDRIFDTYLERGVRPYVEIGFMPRALSRKPDPYQHEWRPGLPYDDIYTGWAHPPRDDSRWEELVYRWVRHCVDRYGEAEVATWYWETWNEANIGYWQGTPEEFLALHDRTIAAVRRALPAAKVGGPDMAGSDPRFLRAFLSHCLERGTPLDFVAFHAKGRPRHVDGHVQMGIAAHLATIDQGFATIASFPGLKRTPIVIGESDPEGCAACQGPQLAYRNGTMYSSYTAASFARKHELADKHGVRLEGALTWAFEFEDQPYFAGFRALSTNGIALPVLNVFRMYSRMGGQRVTAESSARVPLQTILTEGVRGAPDVAALASREADRVAVLVWHYHDDDVPGPVAAVELMLAGISSEVAEARLAHHRIDEHHSNAYAAWRRMGSPAAPSRDQYDGLERASALALLDAPGTVRLERGAVTLRFTLPRQAVSLVTIAWPLARAARTGVAGVRGVADASGERPPASWAPHAVLPVTAERVDVLPAVERGAWRAYLATSDRNARALPRHALRDDSPTGLITGPPAGGRHTRGLRAEAPDAWCTSEKARLVAHRVVAQQTPVGGWTKGIDYTRPSVRATPEAADVWSRGTFDNDATTAELRFLARMISANDRTRSGPWRAALLRGVAYVLAAQYPNGGFPQIYPLAGGYHDAVTYNDSAMVHVLEILRDVAAGRAGFTVVPAPQRLEAERALARGIACVLATQIAVSEGQRTAWAQQHDALTLRPCAARSFEPAAASAMESAAIVAFLMGLPSPSPALVRAVDDATAWFSRVALRDVTWDRRAESGTGLVAAPGAPLLWARLYEVGTDSPVFGDRDRTIHYTVTEVSLERRLGYTWYGPWPQTVLDQYERWRGRAASAPSSEEGRPARVVSACAARLSASAHR